MAKEKNKAATENIAGAEQSGEFEEVDDGDFSAPDDDLFGDVEEVDELDDDMDELDSDDHDDLAIPRRASEEVGRIKEFLSSVSRVRCERYNANLTVIGCHRKKTSTPQRLKNRTSPEDDNIQNHPCFGCLGPIIINWPEGSLPITLKARERRPVIVHPLHENAMLSVRPRRDSDNESNTETGSTSFGGEPINSAPVYLKPPNALRSVGAIPTATLPRPTATPAAKAAKPARPKLDVELEEDYDATDLFEDVEEDLEMGALEDDIETEAFEDDGLGEIGLETEEESFPEDFDDEEMTDEAPTSEAKTLNKKKAPDSRAKKDKDKDKDKDKAPKKDKDSRAKKDKDKDKDKDKAPKKDKAATPKDSDEDEEAATSTNEEHADGDHPPCVSCGKEYTPKYWRGDVCNACYAKQLRERKKTTEEKPQRKKKESPAEVDHPPCVSCGKEYTPKYWRGDVCNACYAKQLRERKRSEDTGSTPDTDA